VGQRRHQVGAFPRGYSAPLATLIAGLLALIAFNLARHLAAPATPHASVHPSVTLTVTPSGAHASPAGQAPAGRGAQPGAAVRPVADDGGAGRSVPSGAPTPSLVPPPPGPSPSPAPSPSPSPGVTAAIVVPLRGATPVTVRAVLVAPAAPPFPDTLLGIGLDLALP